MEKFIQGAIKLIVGVFVVILLIWFGGFVVKQVFGIGSTATNTEQPATGGGSETKRAAAPRRNVVKEQYLRDCAANSAPVTQLGGGGLNCYREPRVTTYID
jgi:hypothetical protein